MSKEKAATPTYIARQPIYDRRMNVYAYELLFRRAPGESAGDVGEAESATTIANALVEIGLDHLVGDKPAFINIPGYMLGHPALELLPKDRVVLELLEDIEPTAEVQRAVDDLAAKGYTLALDDFVIGSCQESLLHACKLVKIDVMLNDVSQLPAKIKQFKRDRLRVLAEKVETNEMYLGTSAMGCDYFQGYFFAKPALVTGKAIPQNRAVLIHLLTRLQDQSVTLDELEQVVANDVTLTYRLLRLVNSASIGLKEQCDSVRSALLILGIERVVALVSLLVMSGVADKPSELLVTAMTRARMCERLATAMGYDFPEKHFAVGLLSVLEALFDVPMATLLQQLPLSQDLKNALLEPHVNSPLGNCLYAVLMFEQGKWDSIPNFGEVNQALPIIYVNSVEWADETTRRLAA